MESRISRLGIKSRAKALFLDSVFPKFCVRCEKEQFIFCGSCLSSYQVRMPKSKCVFCGVPSFFGKTCGSCKNNHFLDGCSSLGSYADPVFRKLVQLWKYTGDQSVSFYIRRFLNASSVWGQLPNHDWVIASVPLHIRRERERGFNQADQMTDFVGEIMYRQRTNLLIRRFWTQPQAQKNEKKRRVGELDGCFTAITDMPKYVLLCDDVVTSGATIDSAAKACKEAGAEVVWGLSLLS